MPPPNNGNCPRKYFPRSAISSIRATNCDTNCDENCDANCDADAKENWTSVWTRRNGVRRSRPSPRPTEVRERGNGFLVCASSAEMSGLLRLSVGCVAAAAAAAVAVLVVVVAAAAVVQVFPNVRFCQRKSQTSCDACCCSIHY